ncbi:MAG: type II toxin-antitoxin system RelB/DinJ family antitoxin [Akkermansiaceae bacterium]|nr:type II toxin-antitoxin system RelB/DinJ family antitoxin [Akkermansiaceae bacterium]
MSTDSILLRTRVPSARYRNAERILKQLGLKPGDAVNLMLAQIELRQGLPFEVALQDSAWLTADQQARAWTEVLGEY